MIVKMQGSKWFLIVFVFSIVLQMTLPLWASDETLVQKGVPAAQSESAEGADSETQAEIFEIVSKKIEQEETVDHNAQANQIAQDLQKITVEQKALIEKSAAYEKLVGSSYDPELVLKAKVALAERKKNLIEKKAEFLRDKILAQATSHAKMQFLLTHVFSDGASFFVVTEQLKEIERKKMLRFMEKRRFIHDMEGITNRIQMEEKYYSAKKVLLAASRDEERAQIQETVSLAEERLKVLQDTKLLLEEQLQFEELRILALQEFDRLIRLRRKDLLEEKIGSRKPYPYSAAEIAVALLGMLLLVTGYFLRRHVEKIVHSPPFFLNRDRILACMKALWFLGGLCLVSWGALNLFSFRVAATALGLLYLNIALGLALFGIVQGLVEFFFMGILQRIAKETQTEIKESSSVFLLVRTVLMWLVFGLIFYKILGFWAFRQEVVGWLLGIANTPLFQSEKIKISVWILIRSVLVFWFFYLGARFLNGILKTRVYPKSSLDKNSQYAIKSVIQFSALVIGVMAGIQLLGIDLSVFSVFTGALGIGIGFGLQDIIKNIFSGFVIFFERPIRMGDVVEIEGVPGVVKSIRTRSTIVNTFDNVSIVIPNSEFLTNRVVNWSHSDRIVRAMTQVGVDYGSDARMVQETLLEIARANKDILPQPEPSVIFEEFADSALVFKLLYWVDVEDRMEVKSQINFTIHTRFKEKGINIPFPQRDLHLKSSDFERTKKTIQ